MVNPIKLPVDDLIYPEYTLNNAKEKSKYSEYINKLICVKCKCIPIDSYTCKFCTGIVCSDCRWKTKDEQA